MEARFTGHGPCGGDVKQRSRHAESWIAGTAGQSSPWMPGTRTKGTGKQGTHERLAGRMGDQRNLEEWCRTVWGPRYVNKAHSGMLGWDGLRGVPEPASGHVECLRPNVTSPQHFSSHACCGCTYSTVHVDGSKGLLDMQIQMHGVAKDASCTDIVHPIAMPPCHPAM